MRYDLPDNLLPAFNQHLEAATVLAKPVFVLENGTGAKQPPPGFWARHKARKAIRLFRACLNLAPAHWQAHWLLGKTYQGLRRYPEALASFQQAATLAPTHPDVLREASIAAMDANLPTLAAHYSALALQLEPENPGLLGNHSINLLVAGQDTQALELIEKALSLAPEDAINKQAHRLITSVISGIRPRPTCQQITEM